MAVVKNAIDLIGNTPIYRIPDTNVYVKLEKYISFSLITLP